MVRKICCFILCCVIIFSFCACENPSENISSTLYFNENQIVVGSANEFPSYNESFSFSDVSTELTSENLLSLNSKPLISDKISSNSSFVSVISNSSKQNSTSAQTTTNTSILSTSNKEENIKPNGTKKINYKTMKAVWISYIDYASILTGKTENQFKSNFETVCKNASGFGINTLICHVRAFSDAAYPSQYFAWGSWVNGIGKKTSYDPLKIMVETAHKYNLSFHAYINPFRSYLDSDVSKVPDSSIFKKWYSDSSKNGINIVKYDNRWYFNPGEPEVRELIKNGVVEIINNYDVDGVHFDDYFYPTNADSTAASPSFDKATYDKYSNGKSLENFRRDSVSTLIKEIYSAINNVNTEILFGISPQANIPNNKDQLFADVELWSTKSGYIDYICPQIYFSYKSESLSFSSALNTWKNLVTAPNVRLIIGISPYRIGWTDTWACKDKSHTGEFNASCGKFGWQTEDAKNSKIIASQVTDCLSISKCSGISLYRYEFLFNTSLYSGTGYKDNAVEQAKNELNELKLALK